jgi:hypothetical protein
MKKLLFSFLFSVVFGLFSSQSIGLVGDFNSWANDVVMATTDNVNYTKTVTFSVSGVSLDKMAIGLRAGGKRFS